MAKRTVEDTDVVKMLLVELKNLRAEVNALKEASGSDPKTGSVPKSKASQPKKTLEEIKKLEKELLELDTEYWAIMEKRSIVAGKLADLYTEIGEKREKSFYDFSTSRQVFAVAKLAPKVEVPLLNMLYKGQLSQVIDLTKRAGNDAARKKLSEYIEQLKVR